VPKRKLAYRIRNDQMGGLSKIIFDSELAAVVNISDDPEIENR
jgi:ribosomal protein S6